MLKYNLTKGASITTLRRGTYEFPDVPRLSVVMPEYDLYHAWAFLTVNWHGIEIEMTKDEIKAAFSRLG